MRTSLFLALILVISTPAHAFLGQKDIEALQRELQGASLGERIARWAEEFVGTPYDPDPLGEYVTKAAIVADERVDCMYHTFRSVELAMSITPAEAVAVALDKRFRTRGILKGDRVLNYEERFEYAMDMLLSGKWGREVTGELAATSEVPGARGIGPVQMIPRDRLPQALGGLRSGDLVFFIKNPTRRIVGEIIGHIGIIKREGDRVWLIHASGSKNGGGEVKKVPLAEYAETMPFVGVKVSRF